jgi:hypothetical protein
VRRFSEVVAVFSDAIAVDVPIDLSESQCHGEIANPVGAAGR